MDKPPFESPPRSHAAMPPVDVSKHTRLRLEFAAARAAMQDRTNRPHRLDKIPFGKLSDDELRELIAWYGGTVETVQ